MTKREKKAYEARLTALRLGLHQTEPPIELPAKNAPIPDHPFRRPIVVPDDQNEA